ncbi:hypothetical protein V6N11_027751 [Hibiscus sabdariffa]|uniref:Uncharacterized protein n=1 Tax=Hibiscus sabdariffa TaxID=183260 RepID=A0ABR2NU85_9ROSI
MFSFHPHSSVTYNNGSNLSENLAPPVDHASRTPPTDGRVSIVTIASVHPLEQPGSPILEFDQQSPKRGKTSNHIFLLNDSKTMEVDDQRVELSTDGVAVEMVVATAVDLDAPKISYASIVIRDGNQVAIDPISSLDDVVATAGDVKVDKSGSFPFVEFSETVHERIDYSMRRSLIVQLLGRSIGFKTLLGANSCALADTRSFTSGQHDVDVYGLWMLAQTRRRRTCKAINRPKGITSPADHFGGSRFSILKEVNGEGMTTEVVAPGETQVPRVDTHVVYNVVGNHSAISILDASKEKCRQNFAISSGKHNTSRKFVCEGLKAGLKLRQGKENKILTKPLLTDWLPSGLASSSASSSGMHVPANPGENGVRSDVLMMAHSAMVTTMVSNTSVGVEPASRDC